MANGIIVLISQTGETSASILLSDIRETTDGPAGYRKAGPVYVPVTGSIQLVYSGDVAKSYDAGAIRQFVERGLITATLVVPADNSIYNPSVDAYWSPVPETVAEALDQIVNSGAGVLQAFRRPEVTSFYPIYVRTTGSDDNDGLTAGTAFATVGRALQVIPEAPEPGAFYEINTGAGTFTMPIVLRLNDWISITGQAPDIAQAYTVAGSQPSNTKTTGNRIILTGAAFTPGALVGRTIQIPSLSVVALIYRNDATTLWVVSDSNTTLTINPSIGATVNLRTEYPTTFAFGDYAQVFDGFITLGKIAGFSGGTTITFDGTFIAGTTINLVTQVGAKGAQIGATYFTQIVRNYRAGYLGLYTGNVYNPAKASVSIKSNGVETWAGEHAFVNSLRAIWKFDGGSECADEIPNYYVPAFPIIRVENVGTVLDVNYVSIAGPGYGSRHDLPDLMTATGGAGFTGSVVVRVGSLSGTRVRIGAASNIVVSTVPNPVAISSGSPENQSADAAGTRIEGGTPAPGPMGPHLRNVTGAAVVLNAATDQCVVFLTTGGAGTITLPLINTVTDGAEYIIVNEDGIGDITVVRGTAGDKINGVTASLSFNAFFGSIKKSAVRLKVNRTTANWMIV